MKAFLSIALGLAALVIAGSVSYYLLVASPNEAKARLDLQKQQTAAQGQKDKQAAYEKCLADEADARAKSTNQYGIHANIDLNCQRP